METIQIIFLQNIMAMVMLNLLKKAKVTVHTLQEL